MVDLFRAVARAGLFCAVLLGLWVAQEVTPVVVEETSLARSPFETGTLSQGDGAFSPDLWASTSGAAVEKLLIKLPPRALSPSLGQMMRRVLLSAGDAPEAAPASLGGRKLLVLARAGLNDEARTIASLSSASDNGRIVGQALAIADLHENDLVSACDRARRAPTGQANGFFWEKLRVLCFAVQEEYNTADLTLGILREQGALSETEDELLTAATIPVPLKKAVAPTTAIELAAMRTLGAVPDPLLFERADVGVIQALAADEAVPMAIRMNAAMHGIATGLVPVSALTNLYRSVEFEPYEQANVRDIIIGSPSDPMTSALAYQNVLSMSSPEFVRDRAALIAAVINTATSFEQAYAAVAIYRDDVAFLEGVIVTPEEAGAFALVEMSAGDGETAGDWLLAMLGAGFDSLAEEQKSRFIELTSLLSKLDPGKASIVASVANVDIQINLDGNASADGNEGIQIENRDAFADIVGSAFNAVSQDSKGALLLSALALSSESYRSDPVADVVTRAAMRAAGESETARQYDLEMAWRRSFPDSPPVLVEVPRDNAARGFAPRLKPEEEQ